jgi:hypothetical protein
MNEQRIAQLAREALDESAEHLPWRVTHRLATAREAALARLPKQAQVAVPKPATAQAAHAIVVASAAGGRSSAGGDADGRRRFGLGLAAIVVPIAIVAAVLYGISEWDSRLRADDIADVDAAVLVDEVPISAYADRGFGVFLRNVAQGDRE